MKINYHNESKYIELDGKNTLTLTKNTAGIKMHGFEVKREVGFCVSNLKIIYVGVRRIKCSVEALKFIWS